MPPSWVSQGLADILGLDHETINQVIVPDLEGYSSDVRLRGHLQDFLGSSPGARAFSDRYVAHRFPPLPGASTPTPPPPTVVLPAREPQERHHKERHPGPPSLKDHIRADLGLQKKKKNTAALAVAASQAPKPSSPSLSESVEAAFGSSGKVYQKNRDDENLFPSRGNSSRGTTRTPGSGSHTPVGRSAGAVHIVESKKKEVKDKGKAKEEKIWDVPKSAKTKRLEGIVADLKQLQAGMGKGAPVDTPPCFCQARLHDLSRYTPQCAACGLILCSLQPAHAPCPSCARPTLSPPALARLILRVEGDVAAQISREQDERDEADRQRKEKLLAESGGGAFPTLPGGTGSGPGKQSTADAARKVLTIKSAAGKGGRRGKATLTTTTYTTPTPPTPSSSIKMEEPAPETMPRPRSPPLDHSRRAKEANKALEYNVENDRPWGDVKAERRGEAWTYVESMVIELPGEAGTGRRKKAKGKGVGVDGRVVVGAAPR